MTIDDIDNLFSYLYSKGSTYTPFRTIVAEHFKNDETTYDIEGMLNKLDKDGFVDTGQAENPNVKLGYYKQTVYKLSFEGRFLFENSFQNRPYLGLKRLQRRRNNWIKLKTIAAAANAIIIILISIWAIRVSDKSNKQERTIQTLQDSIIKLNKLIK